MKGLIHTHTQSQRDLYKVEGILLLQQNYILAGVKNSLCENTPHRLIVHLLRYFTGAIHAKKGSGFLRGSLPILTSVPASMIQKLTGLYFQQTR